MKTLIAAFLISLAVTLVPPPRITVRTPALLYAAAVYKTAVGDTESALRLVQRAEQVQPRSGPQQSSVVASVRGAIFTVL